MKSLHRAAFSLATRLRASAPLLRDALHNRTFLDSGVNDGIVALKEIADPPAVRYCHSM
jgi:hypothetical protein